MRPFLITLLSALLATATVAFAGEPPMPSTRVLSGPTAGSNLPDLGSPAQTVLSKSDEFRLGAMVAKELRDQNVLIEDPEVSEYINDIGKRLASQSEMGGEYFHYFVIKDTTINAFAVTGGYVFFNAGLVLATENESELAGVMAHETAHITQHHIARMLADQSRQSLTTAAAMIGAILLGALAGGPSSSQAIEGGLVAAQGMAVQHQINFTRDNEWEADRVGISYLAGAGFDPYGMGQMFEIMARHTGLAATYIPAMLIDHPMDTEREAEQGSRAAQFPARTGHDSQSYELIRERVRVLTATGDTDLAAQYAVKIAHGGDNMGNQYGRALALMSGNKAAAEEAVTILSRLVHEHEGLTVLYSALGQAQARAGHVGEALATFRHASALFPRNVPVTVRYAETLMAAGHPGEAHTMLLDLFNIVPPTPDQIHLTALAASAANDPGDAYYYMGEYQLSNGDLQLAVQQYQLALASPNISTIQRQRYRARLDEVREFLMSTRKPRLTDTSDQGQGRGGRAH
ncbi:MAG TPA: M48 family metalloprotease [Steroidobacteraceae bacterium]|nr:M48 family metalloprotease [Steroidobacteraceae bacterium]